MSMSGGFTGSFGGVGASMLGGVAGGGVVGRAYIELIVNNQHALARMAQTQAAMTKTATAMDASFARATQSWSQRTGAALTAVGKRWTQSGMRMVGIGSALTRRLSIPIGLVGAAATKMALDFDTALTRVAGLGDMAGFSMDQLRTKVMALSGQTAIAPTELANALFFVSSAGLKSAEVFPVLEKSAQAAMAGMGDVATMGQFLTSVMNNYRKSGLDAGEATNILATAIRMGKAEPAEFAQGLGYVLAPAAQMKIGLDEVAASLAAVTNAGLPTARGITGLRYLIASMANPTEQTKSLLSDFGTSISEVQRSIAREGLLLTLKDMADLFDLNTVKGKEAWQTFIGGARGASVASILVGENFKRNQEIFAATARDLDGVTGSFQKARQEMRQRPEFQFQKAVNELRIAMIELGAAIIPVITGIIEDITGLAKAFSGLSPAVQKTIVYIGLFAAALGPLVAMSGALKVFGGLLLRLAGSMLNIGTAAPKAAAGIAAVTAAGQATQVSRGLTVPAGGVPMFGMAGKGAVSAYPGSMFQRLKSGGISGAVGTVASGAKGIGTTIGTGLGVAAGAVFAEAFATNAFRSATFDPQEMADRIVPAASISLIRDRVGDMSDPFHSLLNPLQSAEGHTVAIADAIRGAANTAVSGGMRVGQVSQIIQRNMDSLIERFPEYGQSTEELTAHLQELFLTSIIGSKRFGMSIEDLTPTVRGFTQALLDNENISEQQRVAFGKLLAPVQDLGLNIDPLYQGMINAAIAEGRMKDAAVLLAGALQGPLRAAMQQHRGAITDHERKAIDAAIADGNWIKVLQLVNQAVEHNTNRLKNNRRELAGMGRGLGRMPNAYEKMNTAIATSSKLTKAQRGDLGQLVNNLDRAGAKISNVAERQVVAAARAGNFKRAVNILTRELNNVPEETKANVKVDGVEKGITDVNSLQTAIDRLTGKTVTVAVNTVASGIRAAAEAVNPGTRFGGIIPLQGGGVAIGSQRRGRFLIGEGQLEHMIPYNQRGVRILADSLRQAQMKVDRERGGSDIDRLISVLERGGREGQTVNVYVQLDSDRITKAQARKEILRGRKG